MELRLIKLIYRFSSLKPLAKQKQTKKENDKWYKKEEKCKFL